MDEAQFTDNAILIIKRAEQLAREGAHVLVAPLHFLAAMLPSDDTNSTQYLKTLVQKAHQEWPDFERIVNRHLVRLPAQTPAPAEPSFSYAAGQVITNATKIKAQQKDSYVAQDHILMALLEETSIKEIFKEARISVDTIKTQAVALRGSQRIDLRSADLSSNFEFLSKYCEDLIEKAREGRIDPVIGREEEIRRVIRVLARRTKSNSVLIGEPGVGKTSIVEGVAQRIVDNDVPSILAHSRLYALDLGALTAGAKYKGEFEERIKGVLTDIEKLKDIVILFVDEIHMLMGDGKSDAANLLKPMLARGALHCIGATTFAEYRKFVSKDGAFERRFQKIDVPATTIPQTVAVLRGLQQKYEIHHGVRILDSALVAAAQLALRYLTYRSLPDSAVDLIDESAATVAVQRDSKPEELDSLERLLNLVEVEINALERDKDTDSDSLDRLEQAKRRRAELEEHLAPLREQFNQERSGHEQLTALKRKLDELENKAHDAERRRDAEAAADLRYFAIPNVEKDIAALEVKVAEEDANNSTLLLNNVVSADAVAETAARLTGIPVSKLTQAENTKLINMEKVISLEVIGQSEAVKSVANAVRLTRSGLANPNQPASFLFLGLSGSGKTELAKKVAGFLFADEKAMIRIDCSELGDKWSASKLLGAAPGYVGYEEGGILTEAVLRRSYSVILFDEVEKAAPEVLTVLLQILDDGRVTSSQGKLVDFSNAIIIMTSNLGAEYINAAKGTKVPAETKELVMDAVRRHFRPEFLNRISSMVVFNRLSKRAIAKIVKIRIKEIQERFQANGKQVHLEVDDAALDYLCENGYSADLGARPLNRLIQSEVLNKLAILLLKGQIKDKETARVTCTENGLVVLPNHDAEDVDMDEYDWDERDDSLIEEDLD